MYSSMMTPVCTETPKSASKPTSDETLKLLCVINQRQQAADAGHGDSGKNQSAHLKDLYIEYRMMKISSTVRGTMMSIRASARTSLWYSPSQPM
jgi:hypothetical protein